MKWWLATLAVVLGFVGSIPAASAEEAPGPPWSASREVSNPRDLVVKLVVFGPGENIPSWFGHAGIVIEDRRLNRSRLYNYGLFEFDGLLLVKFAMGRLWFWVGDQRARATYDVYQRRGRDVRIHRLNLPPSRREQVAEFLAWNVRDENRRYLYHHYWDNCTTRPRDILDEAVEGALRRKTSKPSELTLREHTRRYTYHNFPMDLLLMFMMNDNIDQPIEQWDAMFLPREFERHVEGLEYQTDSGATVPLVASSSVYHEAQHRKIPDRPPPFWHWALLYGLLIGGAAVAAAWWWGRKMESTYRRLLFGFHQVVVGILLGIPGLGLYVMALITDHSVTYWNENLFFANPLTFCALPLGALVMWGRRWPIEWLKWSWTVLVGTGALGIALKVVPGFDQQNWYPIAFILPISVGCAAALWSVPELRRAGDASSDDD